MSGQYQQAIRPSWCLCIEAPSELSWFNDFGGSSFLSTLQAFLTPLSPTSSLTLKHAVIFSAQRPSTINSTGINKTGFKNIQAPIQVTDHTAQYRQVRPQTIINECLYQYARAIRVSVPDTVCSAPPARQPHNDWLLEKVRPIPPSKSLSRSLVLKRKKNFQFL